MSYNFREYNQEQLYLLPESLDDWVDEKSFARFLSEMVDHLWNEGKLVKFYEHRNRDGRGAASFHPLMMLKLLLYCYCQGIMSSRKIAQSAIRNIEIRYLTANQLPRYRAIAEFRKQNLDALRQLFIDVLSLCQETGLAKMGKVALDGRKVAGNTSLSKSKTKESLKRQREELEKEIDEILKQAEKIDEQEDQDGLPEEAADALPRKLRHKKERLQRIKEAHQRLVDKEQQMKDEQAAKIQEREREEKESGKKRRGRKPKTVDQVKDDSKANTTDPDSRILKGRGGFVQGYNAQAIADCESQVIVSQDITQQENDVRQLQPMLENCLEQAGRYPDACAADTGYWSKENALWSGGTELYISTKKDWKQRKACKGKELLKPSVDAEKSLRQAMEAGPRQSN